MSGKNKREGELDRKLKELPDVNAPDALAADVLAALEDRPALAWYQRPYYTWGDKGKEDLGDVGVIDESYRATGVAARQQYKEIGERADVAVYGEPVVEYSVHEYKTTGAWDRLKATALDAGLFVVGSLAMGLDLAASFLAWMVYHVVFWALFGATLGGLLLGQRVERVGGGRITLGAAVVRAFLALLSAVPFFLGFIWASWDVGNQSWHDKVAGTVGMRTRKRR